MAIKRRPQRAECSQCGRRVTILDDGTLVAHRVRKSSAGDSQAPRCGGGFLPPAGDVVEVKPEPVERKTPLPPIEESGNSIRAISTGLPGSSRKH